VCVCVCVFGGCACMLLIASMCAFARMCAERVGMCCMCICMSRVVR